MESVPACPVCDSENVKPVFRTALNSYAVNDDTPLAYRCEHGHVFIPEKVTAASTRD